MKLRLFATLLLGLGLEAFPIAEVPAFGATRLPSLSPALNSDQEILHGGGMLEARVRYRQSRRRYRLPAWGAPRWSSGGAARGGCSTTEAPLIPLIPVDSQVTSQTTKEPTFFGETLAAYPTFFAYVPQTSAREVEFLLIDEGTGSETVAKVVYQKPMKITGTPQIISFQLPSDRPPLQPGRNYHWSFTTVCDPSDQSRDASGNPYIEGLIQRAAIDPQYETKIKNVALRDRPDVYANDGYWLDALTTLAQLRCTSPNDATVMADWTTLLQAIDLSKIPELSKFVDAQQIANAPLSQCLR